MRQPRRGPNAPPLAWDPWFVRRTALFAPFTTLAFQWEDLASWPDLQTCDQILHSAFPPILTGKGAPLRAVSQDPPPNDLAGHYEMRIWERGELQTRTENWHDWFNLLVWRALPRSKEVLNALHCGALQQMAVESPLRRNPRANACTLFDENGAIILASDPTLLELVRRFQWRELFWEHRSAVIEQLRCVVFGHSLYEKALRPYRGMTAHALLVTTDQETVRAPWPTLLDSLDKTLASMLTEPNALATPQDLQPFPLLGVPGWDPDNEAAAYYDDSDYFRPGRRFLRRQPSNPHSPAP